ncbi:MAG: Gfo/Idh/MocA family oxidoreductase [Terracidiphilus sp.]|nr:Gfo/Idh/MocA family oxidoreductase [Terracidiphilus sp.]
MDKTNATSESTTPIMDRRDFMGLAAAGLGAVALGLEGCRSPRAVAPSDWVHLGVIGVGSRGQHMMRMMLRVPGLRITGLCDINPTRIDEGRKVTGEQTASYSDYRKMLESRDIDAVMVSTPLGLHAEHVTAALDSSRAVYGEKSMGRTLDDCNRIRDMVRHTGKIYQVGLQYTYAPWYVEAQKRIRDGKIGKVMQINSYWHRNNNWRRPVPQGGGDQMERLLNWRLYRQWSGGLFAELGSHQINLANAIYGGMPESVMASGGIDFWKDGREIPDNVHAIARYPGGQTLQASYMTTNRLEGAQERVYGTGGSIELTHTEATYFEEPWFPNSAIPPEITIQHKLITGPTYSAEQPYHGKGKTPMKGDASDADFLACRSFVDCIRNRQRPVADENAGWSQGVTVALCNRALEEGRKITLAEFVGTSAS